MKDEVYEATKNEHIPLEEVIRTIHDGVYREGYENGVDDFIDFVFNKSESYVDIRTNQDLHEYLNRMSIEFLKGQKNE